MTEPSTQTAAPAQAEAEPTLNTAPAQEVPKEDKKDQNKVSPAAEAHEPTEAPAAAKPPRKPPEVLKDIGELWRVTKGSPDRPSRLASFAFWASCLLAVALFVQGVRQLILTDEGKAQQSEQAQNLNKFFQQQKEEALTRGTTLDLGKFLIEVKPVPGKKPKSGALNMAEVMMTLECETIQACRYVETNMPKARDRISSSLVSVDREELLSQDGKRALKLMILRQLNGWLPDEHKVKNLYFTKFIIN